MTIADRVVAVFGPMPEKRLASVALAIEHFHERKQAQIDRVAKGGFAALESLLQCDALCRLPPAGRAAILATCHVGCWPALPLALRRAGRNALLVRQRPGGMRIPAGFEEAFTEGGVEQRAFAFKRALEVLGAGGLVVLAIDIPGRIPVSVVGRRLAIAAGPFKLARMSRAPMLPICAQYSHDRIEIALSAPLDSTESSEPERSLAAGAATFWHQCLTRWPEQIEPEILDRLHHAPRAID
jgi:lauroyl/myristoyl acyltransferase